MRTLILIALAMVALYAVVYMAARIFIQGMRINEIMDREHRRVIDDETK